MRRTVAIIGGGPSAMMLASKLDSEKYDVSIYEKMNTIGRKFLVAGKGGFNLTHGSDIDQMISRYLPKAFMRPILENFTNTNLRVFLYGLGIETFTGSSNRIFPVEGIKPVDVLQAFKKRMSERGVKVFCNHKLVEFDNLRLVFEVDGSEKDVRSDIVVFAMGGGSWSKTGSDGEWLPLFDSKGIPTLAFEASNCGLHTTWNADYLNRHEGKPLKNITVSCGNLTQAGEAVITREGLEGGAIYAVVPEVRKQMSENKPARISVHLKPSLSNEEISERIAKIDFTQSVSRQLRSALKLNTTALGLIKTHISKEDFHDVQGLTNAVVALTIPVNGTAEVEEAISTAGGIPTDAVDDNLAIKQFDNMYCIGEMIDWDAPTGGYLLQACFSMGAYLADHLNDINLRSQSN